MTPADEMRAAATRLAELSSAASDGRWSAPQRLTDPDPDGWDLLNGLEGMAEHQVFATSDVCNPRGHADLTWASTMCPLVAAPLARWLDEQAERAEMIAHAHGWELADSNATRNAVEIARVINGAAS